MCRYPCVACCPYCQADYEAEPEVCAVFPDYENLLPAQYVVVIVKALCEKCKKLYRAGAKLPLHPREEVGVYGVGDFELLPEWTRTQ